MKAKSSWFIPPKHTENLKISMVGELCRVLMLNYKPRLSSARKNTVKLAKLKPVVHRP